jgi:hypothetical protein
MKKNLKNKILHLIQSIKLYLEEKQNGIYLKINQQVSKNINIIINIIFFKI